MQEQKPVRRLGAITLLDCWQMPPDFVAAEIGAGLQDLEAFIRTGQGLDREQVLSLRELLDLREDGKDDTGAAVFYPAGAYILLAASTRQKAIDAYDLLTEGGNHLFAFEVFPEPGDENEDWRFVLIGTRSLHVHILAFRRGLPAATLLDDASPLINFDGRAPVTAGCFRYVADLVRNPPAEQIAATRAQFQHTKVDSLYGVAAKRQPANSTPALEVFAARWEGQLVDLAQKAGRE